MRTLTELWQVFAALWNTGSRWLRYAIAAAALWPVCLAVAALTGSPFLTALLALLPAAAAVLAVLALVDPLLLAVVAGFPNGRMFLRWITLALALELMTGVYLAVVPVKTDPALLPLLFLVAAAFAFLTLSGNRSRGARAARRGLLILAVALTAVFVIGGREKAVKLWQNSRSAAASPAYASYPVCPDAKDQPVTAAATAVEIKSYCWSGWLKLPPNTNFRVDAPGEAEYQFWSGQQYLVSDQETRWRGTVPHSVFRVRGKSGFATLYLEK